MNMNSVNVAFTSRYPGVKRESLSPDFFRDNELFDEKIDEVTDDYYTYDSDDLPVFVQSYNPQYSATENANDKNFDVMA